MLDNLYTTKMSSSKKALQSRFSKMRQKNSRFTKIIMAVVSVALVGVLICAAIVMAAIYRRDSVAPIAESNVTSGIFEMQIPYGYDAVIPPSFMLDKDNENFVFRYDLLSSYMSIGTYKVEGNILTATTNDEKYKYVFEIIDEETLKFIQEKSSDVSVIDENLSVPVTDGAIFANVSKNAEDLTVSELNELQNEVDNGHYPWRLDPESVITEFMGRRGISGGKITALAGDGVKCSATYNVNNTSYTLELFKPLKKDEGGIWVVKTFEAKEQFTDEEIASAKAVVSEYFEANAARDRDAILNTVTQRYHEANVVFWMDEEITLNEIRIDVGDPARERYITTGRGQDKGGAYYENVIVAKVDFTVSYDEGDRSVFNRGKYTDYNMILIRDGKGERWLIDDMGY